MATPQVLTYNWTIYQSELVKLQIPVVDGSGQPFDITGWGIDAALKDVPGGTVLYQFPSNNYIISTSTLTLIVPWDLSSTWTFLGGWYRVKILHPTDTSQKYRILQGNFTIQLD
jgi:hypothetical protein